MAEWYTGCKRSEVIQPTSQHRDMGHPPYTRSETGSGVVRSHISESRYGAPNLYPIRDGFWGRSGGEGGAGGGEDVGGFGGGVGGGDEGGFELAGGEPDALVEHGVMEAAEECCV